LARFTCEMAAFLPYTTPDEPVVIVQTIDKIVSIKGSHLLATLKTATSSPPPDTTKQDLARLKWECAAANSIVFLLELKRFLISRYSLGARYKNLAPNEALKGPLTDKLANHHDDVHNNNNTLFPEVQPFSSVVEFSATTTGTTTAATTSTLSNLYKKLKTIMKEDEAEHFPLVTSSPSKPKRAANRSSAAAKKRKQVEPRPKRKTKKSKVADEDDMSEGEEDEEEYRP